MGFRGIVERHKVASTQRRRQTTVKAAAILSAVILSSFAACSLESPKAPRWTVNVSLPLADRHYDIPYLIQHADQPELVWDSVSGARFEMVRTLDTIYIGDNITFGDLTESVADSLGSIALCPQQTLNSGISLSDLYSGPGGEIPAFAAEAESAFPPLVEIEHATVIQGVLHLQVANHLGLTLDSLEIVVANVSPSGEIGRAVFPRPITDDATGAADLNLAGQTVTGNLNFAVYLHTPGGFVTGTDGKSLAIAAYFTDSIKVSQATAIIPPTGRTIRDTVDFSHTIRATEAVFRRGTVAVELHNGTALGFHVLLHSPDLVRDGQPVQAAGYVNPASTVTLTIPLDHAAYHNAVNAVTGASRLRVELDLATPRSTGLADVAARDRIEATVHIISPVVESITGILPPTNQIVAGLQAQLELPDGFENAGLADGELRLELVSSLPFPGSFDFLLSGNHGQHVALTGEILPASAGQPLASAVSVANAAALLHPLPAQISAAGTVVYGDGITSGTVRATDFIVPSFCLVAPLSLYLDGCHHTGDIEGVKLSGEDDELRGRLGAASITAEFENRLPFGVTMEVRLADRRADLPDHPDITLGPTEIPPAVVGADGRAMQAVTSSDLFAVSAQQAHLFEADSIFVIEEIQFHTPDGRIVTVQDRDYIHWRALLQIEAALGAMN